MFDNNIFPKGDQTLTTTSAAAPAPAYDGRPDPLVPLRLLQHVDAPCWQAHAYLVS